MERLSLDAFFSVEAKIAEFATTSDDEPLTVTLTFTDEKWSFEDDETLTLPDEKRSFEEERRSRPSRAERDEHFELELYRRETKFRGGEEEQWNGREAACPSTPPRGIWNLRRRSESRAASRTRDDD